jgi:hypothetical protein
MLEREVAERIEALAMQVDAGQLERVVVAVNTRATAESRQITDAEIEQFVAAETGTVSLIVKQNIHHISAVAESTDIDRASVQTYLAAINLIRRIAARRKSN